MSDITICGAGYIGQSLALKLCEQGHRVRLLSRRGVWTQNPERGHGPCPPKDCQNIAVDLVSAPSASLRPHLASAEQVVLCYAPGRGVDAQARQDLYVHTPERVGAVVDPKARVIAISSTSALPNLDAPLDESCGIAPQSPRGQTAWQAEQALWRSAARYGHELVILRVAGIYGPGRSLQTLYGKDPKALVPGDAHEHTNLCHRDDILAAILAAMALPSPQARLVQVSNGDHPTRREMMLWAAKVRGLEPPRFESPLPQGPPRGKRVANHRLIAPREQGGLGVQLRHPRHRA